MPSAVTDSFSAHPLLLLPDFLLIALGFAICRWTALGRPVWDAAERLVYWLLFPVLLFLAIIKNPMPYIKQANIAHGHQQVNNAQQATSAGNSQSGLNKLLEAQHGNYLDTGAAATAGRADQTLEAVGAVHRA